MVQIKLYEIQYRECQDTLCELQYMFKDITFPKQSMVIGPDGRLYEERCHNMYNKHYLNLI